VTNSPRPCAPTSTRACRSVDAGSNVVVPRASASATARRVDARRARVDRARDDDDDDDGARRRRDAPRDAPRGVVERDDGDAVLARWFARPRRAIDARGDDADARARVRRGRRGAAAGRRDARI
jgi:hypothetical protein